jgi:hypothetical protein
MNKRTRMYFCIKGSLELRGNSLNLNFLISYYAEEFLFISRILSVQN